MRVAEILGKLLRRPRISAPKTGHSQLRKDVFDDARQGRFIFPKSSVQRTYAHASDTRNPFD